MKIHTCVRTHAHRHTPPPHHLLSENPYTEARSFCGCLIAYKEYKEHLFIERERDFLEFVDNFKVKLCPLGGSYQNCPLTVMCLPSQTCKTKMKFKVSL